MKLIITALIALLLTGCALSQNDAENATSVFDRLEFEDNQEGCIRASGEVSIGGNPFAQSKLNVNMVKKQGENPPDC